jgi:hypothetical protein
MGGLILDNIIVFLYRTIRTSFGAYRSRSWPTATGEVEYSYSPEKEGYPFAKIDYLYDAGGQTRSGTYIKGFYYEGSAKSFAASFPSGRKVIIRFRPDDPARSFLREDDQPTGSPNDPANTP